MYKIDFYKDSKGFSDVKSFMDSLSAQAITNKNARIQLKQVVYSIKLLSISGTRVGENVTKHLMKKFGS